MSANLEDTNRSWSWRWVLGVVAAAAVAWLFFGPPTKVVEPTKKTPGQVSVDSVNLKSSLESALSGLKANLREVSDAASAKAALPQLEKEAAEFEKLRKLSVNLPADSKGALAARLASARLTLDGLFDKLHSTAAGGIAVRPMCNFSYVRLEHSVSAIPATG